MALIVYKYVHLETLVDGARTCRHPARVSYDMGAANVSSDDMLIEYLLTNPCSLMGVKLIRDIPVFLRDQLEIDTFSLVVTMPIVVATAAQRISTQHPLRYWLAGIGSLVTVRVPRTQYSCYIDYPYEVGERPRRMPCPGAHKIPGLADSETGMSTVTLTEADISSLRSQYLLDDKKQEAFVTSWITEIIDAGEALRL